MVSSSIEDGSGTGSRGPLNSRCYRLRRKLGFHICPYTIRHAFATEAIMRGLDLISIAKLMGQCWRRRNRRSIRGGTSFARRCGRRRTTSPPSLTPRGNGRSALS